jgi:DNA repair protein RadD
LAVPYRYFAPGVPDLAGVRTLGGDFNRGDIAEVMKDAAIIGDVVKHYRELADGMQGIVFGVDRQHSAEIAAAFEAAGITSAHVDGTMSAAEQAREG